MLIGVFTLSLGAGYKYYRLQTKRSGWLALEQSLSQEIAQFNGEVGLKRFNNGLADCLKR
ncbi:hypothetical protein ACFL2I_07115 [Candidatus Omnitrophota bacterium]